MKASIQSNGYRYKGSALILCALATPTLPATVPAEVSEVQVARGFAIAHLPVMIMEHDKLLDLSEKDKIAVGASLKNKATSWKDFFFEEIHGLAGS